MSESLKYRVFILLMFYIPFGYGWWLTEVEFLKWVFVGLTCSVSLTVGLMSEKTILTKLE